MGSHRLPPLRRQLLSDNVIPELFFFLPVTDWTRIERIVSAIPANTKLLPHFAVAQQPHLQLCTLPAVILPRKSTTQHNRTIKLHHKLVWPHFDLTTRVCFHTSSPK